MNLMRHSPTVACYLIGKFCLLKRNSDDHGNNCFNNPATDWFLIVTSSVGFDATRSRWTCEHTYFRTVTWYWSMTRLTFYLPSHSYTCMLQRIPTSLWFNVKIFWMTTKKSHEKSSTRESVCKQITRTFPNFYSKEPSICQQHIF